MINSPSPGELWERAGGDAAEYRRLMVEAGYLIEGPREPLPCGWPGSEIVIHAFGDDVYATARRDDCRRYSALRGQVSEVTCPECREILSRRTQKLGRDVPDAAIGTAPQDEWYRDTHGIGLPAGEPGGA